MAEHRIKRDIRHAGRTQAAKWMQDHPGTYPLLSLVDVTMTWHVPTKHRRDASSGAPTIKSWIDGAVDAGLLHDDSWVWVRSETCLIQHTPGQPMRLAIEITEVNPMTISLDKRTETATISLIKTLQTEADKGNDLGEITAQVVLVLDYSGSMGGLYSRGVVQDVAERALALSLAGLDDDGNIQVVPFHHESFEPFTVDQSNYQGVVQRWCNGEDVNPAQPAKTGLFRRRKTPTTSGARQMGGTDYLSAIRRVNQLIKDDLHPKLPVLVIFVTDGATSNEHKIKDELVKASNRPVFWQFIGLGYTPQFLSDLDTMGGRAVDNVGLFVANDVANMTDEQFFDEVTTEYMRSWTPAARAKGIIQ